MVPNCIFLHLFHISRSTGFLKEKKKKKKRKKEKELKSIPFINGMKVLNNNAGLLGLLTTYLSCYQSHFSLLSGLCTDITSLENTSLMTCVKQHTISSLSIYPALLSISLPYICLLSQALWGHGFCNFV